MTTPIAEKTHIPPKNWRRHSDPPILWFFVGISSVSLHLLIFWWLRSSNVFGLWLPQESQVVVPIELIEISPSTKSTSKPKSSTAIVAPKPKISAKQSVSTSLSKTEQTIPKNQDSSASLLKKQEVVVSQAKTKPGIKKTVSQPKPTPKTTPKPIFTPESTKSTPTPIPKPKIPLSNLPWNRRQEIVLGKGKRLPNGIPLEQPTDNSSLGSTRNTPTSPKKPTSSTPSSENPNTSARNNSILPTENTPQIPTGATSPTPTENTPQPANENNPTTSGQTGSTATITPLPDQEMRQLSKDLPDVLATYQGSKTKELESTFIPSSAGLAPAQLIVSLIIDRNGNFQQAEIRQIKPIRLQSEKITYEQAIKDLFKNEQFTAGHNLDGSKPDFSNLIVRVVISSGGSN
ncbi:hypothetical protein H6G76_35890 [Nostoc sp. FACHB-152]|uniref:hypothetical protein n=1 Tax=Nostoc sp. FACHB-152 TaxID=2692837 RepID=UPI001682761A|nr:hypothetical protein [Nostoc sp. FACHB-152]MBD2452388.1 hypothetical protein [Nostoc sp. FACHB-152]